MTNTASGITGLLPAPTWRGWMAITREVMEVQEVQEGRLDIVYCCCVLLYVYCSTLLLCALSVSWWWKGIYLSDSKTPITWNHYIITSATLRMQIHTDVPLMYTGYPNTHIALFTDFLYTNKHTKKKSLKHHISLWLNYRLSVSQTWNWIPTPACKAPPSDIKPICRIRHQTTTR